MKKEFKMSQARYDELQKELNYMKTTRSDEVAEMIKVARGFGDLSENSEYDEAKNEMEESGKAIRQRFDEAKKEKITYEEYQALKTLADAGDEEAKKKIGL